MPLAEEDKGSSRSCVTARQEALPPGSEPSAGFTPGPWELEVGDHTHSYVKVTGSDERTVHYMYIASRDYPEIIEANARLIAAAPELYEALKAVVGALDASRGDGLYPDFEVWEAQARAALSKAAGA